MLSHSLAIDLISSVLLVLDVVEAARPAGTALVFGLGPGLVAVIILAIACLTILVFGYSTQHRSAALAVVAVVVLGIALFFLTVKVEDPNTSTTESLKYNRTAVTRAAVAGILIASTVISLFSVLLMHVIKLRQGHLIGASVHTTHRERLF
ncbi:hypothetical protein Poli38472_001575 [Pythium oligandrum]|uniref:Transmembrane protein n=1 Tax=Pythium oligandrum TaxID=41045 RepID=A0A8K1FQH3_PYTOL|nr:hypothetical protein Poli38472_001575 [Pythium oligandrum]|eukprot:TMW69419.1 hypothetical protein Poli38472_001575 [Pythium oligandrum]